MAILLWVGGAIAFLAGMPQIGVAVLAVNLAEPDARVQAFLRQVPLGFPVLMDRDAAAAKAWKARMLPATFIVGADGRVRYSYIGELDWSREPVSRRITELLPR